jgi:hydroxymethylglutaryl-CoA lyase
MSELKIIECPRDAMQGLHEFIPTDYKAEYINRLLKVGFDTLDFGSFVSPKAIPQLRDTAEVLAKLDRGYSDTKLLAIVVNERGAKDALHFDEIDYLGFPFSISETFQQRNTNSSISESLKRLEAIKKRTDKKSKEMVVYLSMGFGNPYGDEWSPEVVIDWAHKMHDKLGVNIISLADTIGVSNPENIDLLFKNLIPALPNVEFGAHLHSSPMSRIEKIKAAWKAGCRRLDTAVQGFGGCPMADDELVGNMATENVIEFLEWKEVKHGLSLGAFGHAQEKALEIFPA